METHIVMLTNQLYFLLGLAGFVLVSLLATLAVGGWRIEKLEKQLTEANDQLAEARKKARRLGKLCKGVQVIKAKLEVTQ